LREETLNKLVLIQALKNKCHLTKEEASKVIEIFFGEMTFHPVGITGNGRQLSWQRFQNRL
jgi:hypothetical protein